MEFRRKRVHTEGTELRTQRTQRRETRKFSGVRSQRAQPQDLLFCGVSGSEVAESEVGGQAFHGLAAGFGVGVDEIV